MSNPDSDTIAEIKTDTSVATEPIKDKVEPAADDRANNTSWSPMEPDRVNARVDREAESKPEPEPDAVEDGQLDSEDERMFDGLDGMSDAELREIFDTALKTIQDLWTMVSASERIAQSRCLVELISRHINPCREVGDPPDIDPSAELPEFPPSDKSETQRESDVIVIELRTRPRRWMDMTFSQLLAKAPKSENNNNVREYEAYMRMLEQLISRGYT